MLSSRKSRYIQAASLCLLAFSMFNLVPYFWFSTQDYQTMGFPHSFWRRRDSFVRFSELSLLIDIALALFFSHRVGQWYQKRGTPDYLTGTRI